MIRLKLLYIVLALAAAGGSVAWLVPHLAGAQVGSFRDDADLLQTQLAQSGRMEPNVVEGKRENRAWQINLTRSIVLDRPIRITSNVRLDGGWQKFALIWNGVEPPIEFGANVGHGGTSNIALTNLTIYAPNAKSPWRWDKSARGNAGNYRFEHLDITTADVKLDLRAPGDGNAYWFEFRDVMLRGPNTSAAVVGRPVNGLFENVRWVNQPGPGPMFEISGTALITNCWCEPPEARSPILIVRGPFSFVRAIMNHYEPHNLPKDVPQFLIDGGGDVTTLLMDTINFPGPGAVEVRNGGVLRFMGGRPPAMFDNGWNPDPRIPLTMSEDERRADQRATGGKVTRAHDQLMELLRKTYIVKGKGSCVQFDGGQIVDPDAPVPDAR